MRATKKEINSILKNNQSLLWKRALAYIIDILIIDFVIAFPLRKHLNSIEISTTNITDFFKTIQSVNLNSIFYISFIIALLSLLYWAILEYKISQSIGKILLKIKVRNKINLTFWQCLLRNISKISTLVLFFDCLYMFITRTNQRYFEKLSQTRVVEEYEI